MALSLYLSKYNSLSLSLKIQLVIKAPLAQKMDTIGVWSFFSHRSEHKLNFASFVVLSCARGSLPEPAREFPEASPEGRN